MTNTPDPIDVHVGNRVRLRRKTIGVSQELLAEHLGLTFQQVQKYERGTNRISSSKLLEIAKRLGVGVLYFFEGLEGAEGPDIPVNDDAGLLEARVALPEIAFVHKIPTGQRRALGALISTMAGAA